MTRRVVVTGMGMVTPLGLDVASNWDALTHGRSGIARISRFDPAPYETQIAGEINGKLAGISEGFAFAIMPPPVLGLGTGAGFSLFVEDDVYAFPRRERQMSLNKARHARPDIRTRGSHTRGRSPRPESPP